MQIVTLTERKTSEARRRQHAVLDLRRALAEYASAHGGRFLLFGSAARGTMRYNSDVDILTDFPEGETSAAWNFAEHASWDRGLDPDVMPRSWCRDDFLLHVEPDFQVLA